MSAVPAVLYAIATGHGVLIDSGHPQSGDLIFRDNTFERSRDGLRGDALTHVAVVVDGDSHGTISFVHHNYRRGVVIGTMNLRLLSNRSRPC